MTVTVNNAAAGGGGGGLALTAAQASAGATGVVASDSAGNGYKQDGSAFSGGGSSAWGSITGTLASQTDLATALNGKLATTAIPSTNAPLAGDGSGNAIAAPSTSVGQPVVGVLTQPFGIAPSGATIGASGGALTLTTAFTETYGPAGAIPYDGIWLWFAAGDTDTGSLAGFYWTVMTSGTAGQVFNNYLAPGNNALNRPPVTPVAYTTNVGKVGTAGTTAQILGWLTPSMAIGYLGPNGQVELEMSMRSNISAGTKTLQPKFSGSNLGVITAVSSASSSTVNMTILIFNKNNATRQGALIKATTGTVPITTAPTGTAFNTGTTVSNVGVDIRLATATDWIVCQYISVKAWPAA